jgi:hypothetical protein
MCCVVPPAPDVMPMSESRVEDLDCRACFQQADGNRVIEIDGS